MRTTHRFVPSTPLLLSAAVLLGQLCLASPARAWVADMVVITQIVSEVGSGGYALAADHASVTGNVISQNGAPAGASSNYEYKLGRKYTQQAGDGNLNVTNSFTLKADASGTAPDAGDTVTATGSSRGQTVTFGMAVNDTSTASVNFTGPAPTGSATLTKTPSAVGMICMTTTVEVNLKSTASITVQQAGSGSGSGLGTITYSAP